MPDIPLRSFAGGEIGPELAARADQVKYQTGLAECTNCIIQRYGSAANRPGTSFILAAKFSNSAARLIDFIFDDDNAYALELGELYMRVLRNGEVLESSPGVPYEIVTPYAAVDVFDIQYTQSGDVMTLVHPDYPVYELARSGHTSWALTEVTFTPTVGRPGAMSFVTPPGAGAVWYRYRVTATDSETGEESLPARGATVAITGVTQANPAVVTAVAHGRTTGDEVYIESVGGMTQINGRTFTVTVLTADTFSLDSENSTSYTAYTSGGTVAPTFLGIQGAGGATVVITWGASATSTVRAYNVFKEQNGVYGFIGICNVTSASTSRQFTDNNITPDLTDNPPEDRSPFEGDYPRAVGYYQQRLCLGGTVAKPYRVELSQIGNFHNFTEHVPLIDSDVVRFSVLGSKVNEVRHLVDLDGLVILTGGAEYAAQGDSDGAVTPTIINLRRQSAYGASKIRPVVIGKTLIFVQARQSIVRDLRFEITSGGQGGYTGNDLTVFAPHLFEGHDIVQMAFAQAPHSILWCVRDDGVLLGLTYLREHDVWAWHRHETDGSVESICCIPEGREDSVYLVVARTVNGSTVRYLERMDSRTVTDIRYGMFLDCALGYDGTNTTATTLTLTGGVDWLAGETLTLTASSGIFVSGDVGNAYDLTTDDGTVRCTVVGYTSATVVTVENDIPVPTSIRATALTTWGKAVDVLTGLGHLATETVGILADGNVQAQQAVTAGGQITLAEPAVVIRAGLPYTSRIRTLELEDASGGTIATKKKRIAHAQVLVYRTRGLLAGSDPSDLSEQNITGDLDTEEIGSVPELLTGSFRLDFPGNLSSSASVTIEQQDPLPMQILGIIPQLDIGRA